MAMMVPGYIPLTSCCNQKNLDYQRFYDQTLIKQQSPCAPVRDRPAVKFNLNEKSLAVRALA